MTPLNEFEALTKAYFSQKGDLNGLLNAWRDRQDDPRKILADLSWSTEMEDELKKPTEFCLWFMENIELFPESIMQKATRPITSQDDFLMSNKIVSLLKFSKDNPDIDQWLVKNAGFNLHYWIVSADTPSEKRAIAKYTAHLLASVDPIFCDELIYSVQNLRRGEFLTDLTSFLDKQSLAAQKLSDAILDDLLCYMENDICSHESYNKKQIKKTFNNLPPPKCASLHFSSSPWAFLNIEDFWDIVKGQNWPEETKNKLLFPEEFFQASLDFAVNQISSGSMTSFQFIESALLCQHLAISLPERNKKIAVSLQEMTASLIGAPYTKSSIDLLQSVLKMALKNKDVAEFFQKDHFDEISLSKNTNSHGPSMTLLPGATQPNSSSFIKNKTVRDILDMLPEKLRNTWEWVIWETAPKNSKKPKITDKRGELLSLNLRGKGEREWRAAFEKRLLENALYSSGTKEDQGAENSLKKLPSLRKRKL